MTASPEEQLVTSDQVILNTISHLDGYLVQMMNARSQVDEVMGRIGWNYQAESSKAFLRKVEEWIIGYDTIMQKYQTLIDSTQGAQKFLTQAEEEAHASGGNWGGPIFDVLNG
ncbi:hypothetical protein [Streptomyces sp. NPDC054961]